jgi:DNA-binding response OmpR family regulator
VARMRLEQAKYDVLLLDLEMPHRDGYLLLEEIRSNERLRHLPVIILTCHDDIASIDRSYQSGTNSFATKPVNWRQLSYHIRDVIRMSRAAGLQAGSQLATQGQGSGPKPAATDRAICDFLQSIIHRADALEQQLPFGDRARFSEQISEVRASVERAIAAYSKTRTSAIESTAPGGNRGLTQ